MIQFLGFHPLQMAVTLLCPNAGDMIHQTEFLVLENMKSKITQEQRSSPKSLRPGLATQPCDARNLPAAAQISRLKVERL